MLQEKIPQHLQIGAETLVPLTLVVVTLSSSLTFWHKIVHVKHDGWELLVKLLHFDRHLFLQI
jgi:hypothetical protein